MTEKLSLKERRLKASKKWADNNKDKIKEYHRKRYLENKEDIKKSRRKYWLKSNYNMTVEDYDTLLKLQNNKCAICETEKFDAHRHSQFDVDHCHLTGKVRGLLCSKCNTGIGHLRDDVLILQKAIKYLEKYQY